jgi:hypothetical protein
MVNSRGGMVASITRRATVGTAGGEGPPDYVSDVEVPDEATIAPPAPPHESNYAVSIMPPEI